MAKSQFNGDVKKLLAEAGIKRMHDGDFSEKLGVLYSKEADRVRKANRLLRKNIMYGLKDSPALQEIMRRILTSIESDELSLLVSRCRIILELPPHQMA